jgi:hypothetical protein
MADVLKRFTNQSMRMITSDVCGLRDQFQVRIDGRRPGRNNA